MRLNISGNTQKTSARNQAIYFLALILVAAIVVFILWQRGFIGGKAGTKTPQESIYSIFKRPAGQGSSGTTQVSISGDVVSIKYNFFPVGITSFKNELGIELSDKIQKFFKNTSTYRELLILASAPFDDKFGNRSWKPIVSFKFTESLYYMTKWENFIKQNLLDIVEDVTWLRKID